MSSSVSLNSKASVMFLVNEPAIGVPLGKTLKTYNE